MKIEGKSASDSLHYVRAWGICENGKLWDCAFSTRHEALTELAGSICTIDPKAQGEWSARVVRVEIAVSPAKEESA